MFDFVNSSEEEVLEVLCRFPDEEFTVSGLARKCGKSKSLVSEKLSDFKEDELISVKSKGNSKFVSFERNSDKALKAKRLMNLNALYQAELIDDLVDFYDYPEAVILFGSFAKGEDTYRSDIDISIVSRNEESFEDREIWGRNVSVTVFKRDEIPDNMLETLANGITVHGYLEV